MDYLSKKDLRLGEVIQRLGPLERPLQPDLFTSLVNSIVGQQISSAAQRTIWQRIVDDLAEITPAAIGNKTPEEIQSYGISMRKAGYIYDRHKRC